MEQSPRLTITQLAKDRRVPKDALLRGASPEEVAGAVRGWLANERPSFRGVTITLATDEDALLRVERRWIRLCRANGIPEHHALIARDAGACRFFAEIVLMPRVVSHLAAESMMLRALAARTLMHEWWHVSRRQDQRFYPFEEGSAEVFADAMCQRAFGFTPPKTQRVYSELSQAIELIGDSSGFDNWYLASRNEENVEVWLRDFLTEQRYNPTLIQDVLRYTTDDETWLARVRRMISSQGGE